MRVPVLAVLPAQDTFSMSAQAGTGRRGPPPDLTRAKVPGGFEIDPDFAAVPVGPGPGAGMTVDSMRAERSETFVVRGFVDVPNEAAIPERLDGEPLFSDPVIAPFVTCGGSPALGGVADVAKGLNLAAIHGRGLKGANVAIAIMDTGINLAHLKAKLGRMPRFDAANSWRPSGSTIAPGAHPVDHGTMCAFDALIAAPDATLLDFPILAATAPGGAMTGRTLSGAVQAYAQLLAYWAVAFAGGPRYNGLVVSNSWGIYHRPGISHRGIRADMSTTPSTPSPRWSASWPAPGPTSCSQQANSGRQKPVKRRLVEGILLARKCFWTSHYLNYTSILANLKYVGQIVKFNGVAAVTKGLCERMPVPERAVEGDTEPASRFITDRIGRPNGGRNASIDHSGLRFRIAGVEHDKLQASAIFSQAVFPAGPSATANQRSMAAGRVGAAA